MYDIVPNQGFGVTNIAYNAVINLGIWSLSVGIGSYLLLLYDYLGTWCPRETSETVVPMSAAEAGWTWEALEAAEEAMARDQAAEEAQQARCRAREAEEELWVDSIVAEQAERQHARAQLNGEAARAREAGDRFGARLASFGLRLSHEQGCAGRGIISDKDLEAGAIVLTSPPATAVVAAEAATSHCHHCFRASSPLMRCSGCRFARYCSRAHQQAAWGVHSRECSLLRKTKHRVPGASIRLLARVLWLLGEQSPASEWACSAGAVLSLDSQWRSVPSTRRETMQEQAAMLCALLRELDEKSSPSPQFAAEMLSLISLNCHTICDDQLQEIELAATAGVGLYPLAALTNHSCAPSAVQTFDGDRIVLRALRSLPAGACSLLRCLPVVDISLCTEDVLPYTGSPIHIGYIELADSRATRIAALEEAYLFTCHCERCFPAPTADKDAQDAAEAEALKRARQRELAAIDRGQWDDAAAHAQAGCKLAGSSISSHFAEIF
ncbi:MAG: hypothetical protein SGPRY_007492 [Prymnesium sp.]